VQFAQRPAKDLALGAGGQKAGGPIDASNGPEVRCAAAWGERIKGVHIARAHCLCEISGPPRYLSDRTQAVTFSASADLTISLRALAKMQLKRNAPLYSRQAIVVGHPIKGGQ
jgi:hypothetical protein